MQVKPSNNLMYIVGIVCVFLSTPVQCQNLLPYLADDLADIIAGLSSQFLNLIPTIDEIFNASLQLFVGLPESTAFEVIDQLCSIYFGSGQVNPRVTPNIDEMYLQLRTPCRNISVPLKQAEELLETPEFDPNKKIVVFVTGWTTNITNPAIEMMAQAFHCRGGYNFLALNASNFIRTLYEWSAYNTEEIGEFLAEGLQKLTPTIPIENMYLVGHSLGAQIVGATGRHFTELTNRSLPRITGLDPANPCFNQGEFLTGIFRGDAEFVDIIHTNPGVFGKKDPLGDVDFYAGGLGPIKPGCNIGFCSHTRAYLYYIESVYPENENNFLAKRCTSLTRLNNGFCDGPEYPMGFATPTFLNGNYFLGVNTESPYGENATADAIAEPKECFPCESN